MKTAGRLTILCFAVVALAAPGYAADETARVEAATPPMTVDAAATLLQALGPFTQSGGLSGFVAVKGKPRVTGTQIEVEFVNGGYTCTYADNPDPSIKKAALASPPTRIELNCSGRMLRAWASAAQSAKTKAAWSTMLSLSAPESEAERLQFATALQAFQAQSVGPEVGEDVRAHKVLAEAAVRDTRLWDAVAEFDRALALAPWWPQGNYNIALIYAELHAYPRATRHMQRYLQLVPDAANARAAQDKIYEWSAAAKRVEG